MNLLTTEIRRALPRLYATEGTPLAEKILVAKWFHPASAWTWYAAEGEEDEEDFLFFGFVDGGLPEWGYFRLSELQTAHSLWWGLAARPVERDIRWKPTRAGAVIAASLL